MAAPRTPALKLAEPRRARQAREHVEPAIAGKGLDFGTIPEFIAIDPVALATWQHVASTFAGMPTRFRESDRTLLIEFCQTVSLVRRVRAQLDVEGLMVPGRMDTAVKNPLTSVLNAQLGHLHRLARELGLSPAGRNMLGLADKPDVEDRAALDALFGGGEQ